MQIKFIAKFLLHFFSYSSVSRHFCHIWPGPCSPTNWWSGCGTWPPSYPFSCPISLINIQPSPIETEIETETETEIEREEREREVCILSQGEPHLFDTVSIDRTVQCTSPIHQSTYPPIHPSVQWCRLYFKAFQVTTIQ